MATDLDRPVLLFEIGPPPWEEIVGHPSCKYAAPHVARAISHPWVWALVERMLESLPGAGLVDIRWWENLLPGELPGLPDWHRDCFNEEAESDDEHRLYFAGAGCRTMFRPDYQPPEGWVIAYGRNAEHRIMPATVEGPRLLVRVSKASIKPANRIHTPTVFRLAS